MFGKTTSKLKTRLYGIEWLWSGVSALTLASHTCPNRRDVEKCRSSAAQELRRSETSVDMIIFFKPRGMDRRSGSIMSHNRRVSIFSFPTERNFPKNTHRSERENRPKIEANERKASQFHDSICQLHSLACGPRCAARASSASLSGIRGRWIRIGHLHRGTQPQYLRHSIVAIRPVPRRSRTVQYCTVPARSLLCLLWFAFLQYTVRTWWRPRTVTGHVGGWLQNTCLCQSGDLLSTVLVSFGFCVTVSIIFPSSALTFPLAFPYPPISLVLFFSMSGRNFL